MACSESQSDAKGDYRATEGKMSYCIKARQRSTGGIFTLSNQGTWEGGDSHPAILNTHAAARFVAQEVKPGWASETFAEKCWWTHPRRTR